MSLEVLFHCEKDHLRRREDAIVCSLHCCLTANGYKCIGRGEEVPTENVRKSDMLPAGWSDGDCIYSLWYESSSSSGGRSGSDNYLLKIISVDGTLLVHLLRMTDEKMADMSIKTEEFASEDLTSFDTTYKNADLLRSRFQKDILDVFISKPSQPPQKSTSETNQVRPNPYADPLRVPTNRPQARHEWEPPRNPFGFGRSDLDPLSSGIGGGMYFDPLRSGGPPGAFGPGGGGGFGSFDPSGFPRSSRVPGARFDPVLPYGVDPRGNYQPGNPRFRPDPDLEPPPGYDDMFM